MPNLDLFARLGLLVVPHFLDEEMCARQSTELQGAAGEPATLRRGLEPSVRRATWAEVPSPTRQLVQDKLLAFRPRLETHFRLPLTGFAEAQFLRYEPGGFYRPHCDNNRLAGEPDNGRRVSIVVFLNAQSEHPRTGTYGGGSLIFYGLMPDPRLKEVGIPLVGTPGLLVAFPSDLLHEVASVNHGVRYTIVTWAS